MTTDGDAVAALLRTRVASAPIDLPVAGDSMAGVIAAGSTVTVTAQAAPRRGEIWAFAGDDGTVIVHRVREIEGTTVVGRGTANTLDDAPVAVERLIGRVRSANTNGATTRFGALDAVRARLAFAARKRLRRLRR
ncbi:MAG: S24/S26 family peptidase [Actinomycetota bacterium]